MQQLNVNLTIPIPGDSVLISKIELEELKKTRAKRRVLDYERP